MRTYIRAFQRPTAKDKIGILERRRKLRQKIGAYENKVATLGVFNNEGCVELEPRIHSDSLEEDGSDGEVEEEADCPEHAVIFLPSQMNQMERQRCGLVEMGNQEAALRIGQMNDALHSLRMVLGEKSLMLRTSVRNAHSQKQVTRAWGDVNRLEAQVQRYCNAYERAWKALATLGVLDSRYPEITRDDLKMPGDITEENRIGQRSDSLAWFWRLGPNTTSGTELGALEDTPQMQECMFLINTYISETTYVFFSLPGELASCKCTIPKME